MFLDRYAPQIIRFARDVVAVGVEVLLEFEDYIDTWERYLGLADGLVGHEIERTDEQRRVAL